ncbi:MAG: hypothetical protein H6730_16455 [Deltaproteobacteria bacterium]|nr:hypothetical protein [Deltaproteobacteria bacterium]
MQRIDLEPRAMIGATSGVHDQDRAHDVHGAPDEEQEDVEDDEEGDPVEVRLVIHATRRVSWDLLLDEEVVQREAHHQDPGRPINTADSNNRGGMAAEASSR